MLTADTITDEQIRAFGDQANADGWYSLVNLAARALAVPPVSWESAHFARLDARGAVARILNERACTEVIA